MPENQNPDKPKIIVDQDWKAQAAAEKEKLAQSVEKPQAAGAGPAGQAGAPQELPPPTLSVLLQSLATQVLLSLGGVEDPKTKRRYVDLEMAKHYIDTLAMLEDKTKNNRTEEETRLLNHLLYETRLRYVEIAQRIG